MTWTSRSPVRATASPRSRWTSRSRASAARSWSRRSRRRRMRASRSSGGWPTRSRSRAPRSPSTRRASRRSRSTRSSSGWSSARAARRSARSSPSTRCRSTSRRTARSSCTPPRAPRATPPIEAIRNLTKEPEVGDTYTGRVVKTTDFGAFVELKKGTDGLLHVSNVGPGRVNHIEDVIARGDILDVRRAGGRQGPRPHRPQARPEAREGERWSLPRSSSSGRRTPRRASPARIAARAATATRGGRGGPRREREGSRSRGSTRRRREAARPRSPTASSSSASAGGRPGRRPFDDARPARARWLNMPREPRDRDFDTLLRTVAPADAHRASASTTRLSRLTTTSPVGAVVASRRQRDNYELAYLAQDAAAAGTA